MKPARMDRLVTLQQRTLTRNAVGEEIATYTDVPPQVWAEKQDLGGREWVDAQQKFADVDTRWRIRWRADVTVLHRLVADDGVPYDIKHTAEIGRQQGLELITTARRT